MELEIPADCVADRAKDYAGKFAIDYSNCGSVSVVLPEKVPACNKTGTRGSKISGRHFVVERHERGICRPQIACTFLEHVLPVASGIDQRRVTVDQIGRASCRER